MEEDKKKEIAVVGSEKFTLGFRLAGIQKTYTPEDIDAKMEELLENPELGIIITEEELIQKARKKTRQKIEESVDPVIIGLSEQAESQRLKQKIKTAIGADITK